MEAIEQFIQVILHLDQYLQVIVTQFGPWIYTILFSIIFIETGLIILPFLPGDSLLFAAGSLAGMSELNVHYLAILLTLAAILGDTVNYALGKWIGPNVFLKENTLCFNKKHLDKAHAFYEKYGGKTIVLARFIPIIRTFAPFVAGLGAMNYYRFLLFNIVGAFLWVFSLLYLSYWFGNIALIKNNFSLVVIAIIFLSILPPFVELIYQKKKTS